MFGVGDVAAHVAPGMVVDASSPVVSASLVPASFAGGVAPDDDEPHPATERSATKSVHLPIMRPKSAESVPRTSACGVVAIFAGRHFSNSSSVKIRDNVRMRYIVGVLSGALVSTAALPAFAVGEGKNGFPNWSERVVHEWMNRARVEPAIEMQKCGAACGDSACFTPVAQLAYAEALNHSARFHSDEMAKQGYFAHDSACTLVANINMLYPATCDGSASCACVGGMKACSGACTSWSSRVQLFGTSTSGEIIASGSDPDGAFYQWLFESYPTTQSGSTCHYDQGPPTNGHRWNILKSMGTVGVGVSLTNGSAVGDFGGGGGASKIQSGSHYPRAGASVDVWVNFSDTAAPKQALVNVDGSCTQLTRARGTDTNGAWTAKIAGVATGCHRYYFAFEDSTGTQVLYPSTGSLGIGPAASCADWDPNRPAAGANCTGLPPGQDAGTTGDDGGTIGGGDDSGVASGDGGAGRGNDAFPSTDSGCGCRVGTSNDATIPLVAMAVCALVATRRRRR